MILLLVSLISLYVSPLLELSLDCCASHLCPLLGLYTPLLYLFTHLAPQVNLSTPPKLTANPYSVSP